MEYDCDDFEQAKWLKRTRNCCKNCRWWDRETGECDRWQKIYCSDEDE